MPVLILLLLSPTLADEAVLSSFKAHMSDYMAYHKGSCDIVPQAPLFVKPGTFDEFSTGNRILPAG